MEKKGLSLSPRRSFGVFTHPGGPHVNVRTRSTGRVLTGTRRRWNQLASFHIPEAEDGWSSRAFWTSRRAGRSRKGPSATATGREPGQRTASIMPGRLPRALRRSRRREVTQGRPAHQAEDKPRLSSATSRRQAKRTRLGQAGPGRQEGEDEGGHRAERELGGPHPTPYVRASDEAAQTYKEAELLEVLTDKQDISGGGPEQQQRRSGGAPGATLCPPRSLVGLGGPRRASPFCTLFKV